MLSTPVLAASSTLHQTTLPRPAPHQWCNRLVPSHRCWRRLPHRQEDQRTEEQPRAFLYSDWSTVQVVQPETLLRNSIVHIINELFLNTDANPTAALSAFHRVPRWLPALHPPPSRQSPLERLRPTLSLAPCPAPACMPLLLLAHHRSVRDRCAGWWCHESSRNDFMSIMLTRTIFHNFYACLCRCFSSCNLLSMFVT
jgi:hypothetical protein